MNTSISHLMLFRDITLAAKITAGVKESQLSTVAGTLEDVFLQTAFHMLQLEFYQLKCILNAPKHIQQPYTCWTIGRYHQL